MILPAIIRLYPCDFPEQNILWDESEVSVFFIPIVLSVDTWDGSGEGFRAGNSRENEYGGTDVRIFSIYIHACNARKV